MFEKSRTSFHPKSRPRVTGKSRAKVAGKACDKVFLFSELPSLTVGAIMSVGENGYMIYSMLGKTNLVISRVGLGGIPLQRLTLQEATETVRYALDCGVNFIDTARGYTVSERYIGAALAGGRRNDVVLATKAPPLDYSAMLKEMEGSLDDLATDYIDLYQVHNVKDCASIDRIFAADGAYAAFLEMKAAGKIGHFGVTSHKREVLAYLLEKYADKTETIMFPYNIVETQGEELFTLASGLNVAVIVMKPLAGGAIENAALAMRFALSNPDVSVVIPGMAEKSEVDINTAQTAELSDADREECKRLANALGSEFCRRCSYCAPCPAGLDIPTIFTFEGYLKRYDLADWAKDRYMHLQKRAKDCVKCGECERKCPYELKIRDRMQTVAQEFADAEQDRTDAERS